MWEMEKRRQAWQAKAFPVREKHIPGTKEGEKQPGVNGKLPGAW